MIHDVRISSISFVLSICAMAVLMTFVGLACGTADTGPRKSDTTSDEQLAATGQSDLGVLEVTSSALPEGKNLPIKYACEEGLAIQAGEADVLKESDMPEVTGQDISPPLSWSAGPQGTKSFAIAFYQYEVQIWDEPFVQWVIYNIPLDVTHFDEGVPHTEVLENGSVQGVNDFGVLGYGGPCPNPAQGKIMDYIFTVYAVDMAVNLSSGATKEDLLKEISGHVLAKGQLSRPRSACNPDRFTCD